MKFERAIVATALLIHGGVVIAADPIPAGKTRAEVRKEASDARAAGQISVGDDPLYPARAQTTASKPSKRKVKREERAAAAAKETPPAPKQ